MLIIVDKKIPEEAKVNLRQLGELMEIKTSEVVYPAISGHPDIFFTQVDEQLVVAPNLPSSYREHLKIKQISFQIGENIVGVSYPETAKYNAVVTSKHLVHNLKITDAKVLKLCESKAKINVNQGYTRCNLIFLNDDFAITSDAGIAKELIRNAVEVLFVATDGIDLPGFKNGFFGGCCGVFQDKLFVLGNLDKYSDGERIRSFTKASGFSIFELCDTPLFDGGGMVFIS